MTKFQVFPNWSSTLLDRSYFPLSWMLTKRDPDLNLWGFQTVSFGNYGDGFGGRSRWEQFNSRQYAKL